MSHKYVVRGVHDSGERTHVEFTYFFDSGEGLYDVLQQLVGPQPVDLASCQRLTIDRVEADGPPFPRDSAYYAIDTERDYQDALGEDRCEFEQNRMRNHSVGDHLVMLKVYVDRALLAWTDNPGDAKALDVVRKVAGIAVRCMEYHGAPERSV